MITVLKPATIPSKLTGAGVIENDKNCKAYDHDPNAYINDVKEFNIKPSIYNHQSIKKSLKSAQHSKCCFCEKEQKDEYGAVEHYRPKAGYQPTEKKKLIKPGYYWLGYDWSNLYFVCSVCNTSKANQFPLVDENKRAKSHHYDISKEVPYLLDPSGVENPRNHIVFDLGFVRGTTEFGKKTIKICGLDRDGLNEKRNKLISDIDFHIQIIVDQVNNSLATVQKAKNFIRECRKPEAEFSAVAIDYLSQFNISIT